MDVATLKARIDARGAFVVDVRTPGEFAQGHVPGAVNIPLQELKARIGELEPHRSEDFAVICAVGGRSAAAVDYLRSQGFDKVVNVVGGTKAWVQAGYPVE
ncbi:MAG: rhodanese-like domain-containing protein [Deltaproteobacteria bacterium]|nr:MAG: rhodanese-like domain-containing protein [Deltaproteobacteria bacterium]